MAVTEPVLAISPGNDRMHVGSAAVVLSHVKAEAQLLGTGLVAVPWQFFDAAGQPLVEDGGSATLVANGDAADRAGRQVLVARVDLVLAHAQAQLDAQLAKVVAGGDQVLDTDPVRMVRVQGELSDVLRMLAALDADLDPSPTQPNPGSWWHNLWAHWG